MWYHLMWESAPRGIVLKKTNNLVHYELWQKEKLWLAAQCRCLFVCVFLPLNTSEWATFITSAKEVMFLPMSVCCYICQQDYKKTTEPICSELVEGWGMGQGRSHYFVEWIQIIYYKFKFSSLKSHVCCLTMAFTQVLVMLSVILVLLCNIQK